MDQPRLVLASSSPRRLAILKAHGLDPEVFHPNWPESLAPGLSLADLPSALEQLALDKAAEVSTRTGAEPALVLAADTVVFADDVLGKPADPEQARAMLAKLSGKTHQVLTAVAIINEYNDGLIQFTDQAEVSFKDYGADEIEAYLLAEPPYDKAGAYAIQGIWRKQVANLVGDIDTVIGLPWQRLAPMLADCGLTFS